MVNRILLALTFTLLSGTPAIALSKLKAPQVSRPGAEKTNLEGPVRAVLGSRIDTSAMAARLLERRWNQLSADEKATLVSLVEPVIKKYHQRQLDQARAQGRTWVTQSESDGLTRVIAQAGGSATWALRYDVRQVHGAWTIEDIIVDDLSVVKSWSTQYEAIYQRDGLEGVFRALRAAAQR